MIRKKYLLCCILLYLCFCLGVAQPAKSIAQVEPDPQILALTWSPSGLQYALGLDNGQIQIWDALTSQPVLIFPVFAQPGALPQLSISALAWSPDGQRLAVSINEAGDSAYIQVFEASTGQLLAEYDGENQSFAVAWSPNSRFLAGAATLGVGPSALNQIRIWDVTTNELVSSPEHIGYNSLLVSLAWSPDGSLLASASYDQRVILWDTTTWQPLLTLEHPTALSSVDWGPDGNKLITGSYDGSVRLWDANTGQELTTLATGYESVFDVAWQPGGSLVAVAAGEEVQFWDITTSTIVRSIPSPQEFFLYMYVAWSPDGHQLLYGSSSMSAPAITDAPVFNDYPFFEDFETGADKWALTSHWTLNGAQFYSGAWSMRNARSTDYTAFTDTLTLIDPLNLNNAVVPYLTYQSRFNLSTNERVQVQVSADDGASWTTVETYSEMTDLTWKPRRIDLRAYAGQPIRLRFVFVAAACESNCTGNKAWWIDDVKVDEFPAAALDEGYETGTDSWTLTGYWAHSNTQHHDGSWSVRNARGTDYNAFTDTLTLNDPLDLSEFSAPLLTFWARYKLSSYETIRVQVYVVGSGPWTTIQTISNLTNLTWMRQRVDLSPYSGHSIRLRFVFSAAACSSGCTNNTVWWIDDVTIAEQPAMTFADDFELGITNWTMTDRWAQSTAAHYSGSWAVWNARETYYDPYTGLLTLNMPLDLSTSDIPILSFWTRYRLSSYEPVEVQIHPEGSPDWIVVWDRVNETSLYWSEGIWWLHQVDLSSYKATPLQLRFRFRANACDPNCVSNRRWWVDDVQIAELPPPSGDLPFVDNFEGLSNNWVATNGWGLIGSSMPPDNMMNYSMVGQILLTTYQNPETLLVNVPLDLTGIRQPKLRFRTKYWFLGYPAYGAVQVSVDGGAHWDTLEEIENATATNWQSQEADLSPYAGRSIQLRFRLYSTIPSVSEAVWEIDDVVIQDTAP